MIGLNARSTSAPHQYTVVNRVSDKRATGDKHEDRALDYLQSRGLVLQSRNYHSRHGEIDLIMRDGETLVFVEVRYRKSNRFGGAVLSITPAKQRKIALTALQYLQKHKKTESPCRFDAVAITDTNTEWIKAAFDSPL
jgi:putative endonuclease